MPRRSEAMPLGLSLLSIPHELHRIKAREIYERRIAKGRSGSPEGDWETARRYLTRYPRVVRAWQRNQAIAFYRRLPRSFFRRLGRSFKALIGLIGEIITFPFWLFYKLPQLFTNTDTRPFALDVVKTIISAASLLATIIAAIGLLITYQDTTKDRQLTQERLVTDRFAKAVEQIGNDKEVVVIGGIYSLERIAHDSPEDQWTIMEVLTAFVRENSPIPLEIQKLEAGSEEELKALEKLTPVDIQIQAALTVIRRRDPEQDYTSDENRELNTERLDLNNSNLRDADLRRAKLTHAYLGSANFRDADLRSADFTNATLFGANLFRANLFGADLRRAKLTHAYLRGADFTNADLSGTYLGGTYLREANFRGANLRGTKLGSADFSGTYLNGANLREANLSKAENLSYRQIKSACFWEGAIYTAAKWNETEQRWIAEDEEANQKRIEEIKQDEASDPETPPDCDKWN